MFQELKLHSPLGPLFYFALTYNKVHLLKCFNSHLLPAPRPPQVMPDSLLLMPESRLEMKTLSPLDQTPLLYT